MSEYTGRSLHWIRRLTGSKRLFATADEARKTVGQPYAEGDQLPLGAVVFYKPGHSSPRGEIPWCGDVGLYIGDGRVLRCWSQSWFSLLDDDPPDEWAASLG